MLGAVPVVPEVAASITGDLEPWNHLHRSRVVDSAKWFQVVKSGTASWNHDDVIEKAEPLRLCDSEWGQH